MDSPTPGGNHDEDEFDCVSSASGWCQREILQRLSNEEDSPTSTPHQKEEQQGKLVSVAAAVPVHLQYTVVRMIADCGSFGAVYLGRMLNSGEKVAIKRVVHKDESYQNHELDLMRRLDHPNVVKLRYFFFKKEGCRVYLNLVMEYFPYTLEQVVMEYESKSQVIPPLHVKIYAHQLFRALAYLHSLGICHRNVKPANVLLNVGTSVLKLCDFGSSKELVRGVPNSTHCSSLCRSPELILKATDYTTCIDMWSAGAVLAEMLQGRPLFPGGSDEEQLKGIVNLLGTPTPEEIQHINPRYRVEAFPKISEKLSANPWAKAFRCGTPPEAVDLVSKLLCYTPSSRLTPWEAMAHEFFSQLRTPDCKLSPAKLPHKPLPPLFDFTEEELASAPSELLQTLLPRASQQTEQEKQKSPRTGLKFREFGSSKKVVRGVPSKSHNSSLCGSSRRRKRTISSV